MICEQVKDCIEDKVKKCRREDDCICHTDNRASVVCREKGKRYHLINDTGMKIRKYTLDGGIVRDEQGVTACDNLLVAYGEDTRRLIFAELKGHEFTKAVEQVKNDIQRFTLPDKKSRVYARIVHTQGAPRIRNVESVRRLEELVRGRGGNFKMHERTLEERLSDIDEKDERKI